MVIAIVRAVCRQLIVRREVLKKYLDHDVVRARTPARVGALDLVYVGTQTNVIDKCVLNECPSVRTGASITRGRNLVQCCTSRGIRNLYG